MSIENNNSQGTSSQGDEFETENFKIPKTSSWWMQVSSVFFLIFYTKIHKWKSLISEFVYPVSGAIVLLIFSHYLKSTHVKEFYDNKEDIHPIEVSIRKFLN